MKILAVIIIVLCVAFNVVVGSVLFSNSLSPTTGATVTTTSAGKLVAHNKYRFTLVVPKDMESQGSRVESNVLDSYFVDTPQDDYDPILQINVYGDVQEGNIATGEEYKRISGKDFLENSPAASEIKYHDGGITTNPNGVKFYYDVITHKLAEGNFISQKRVTFYHSGSQFEVYWTDDPAGFISSSLEFDKVVNSIKTY